MQLGRDKETKQPQQGSVPIFSFQSSNGPPRRGSSKQQPIVGAWKQYHTGKDVALSRRSDTLTAGIDKSVEVRSTDTQVPTYLFVHADYVRYLGRY